MPRNGSGVATLAESPFVPNTPISSAAVNSDLSDIANMLTGSVASDGQTTITGQLKGASGSVGLPSYSFSADLDSGMYRIGANNIGISVNSTKILDIGVGGLTATYLVQPAGTVLLPTYTFAGDLDSGFYSIGANNIGVSVNAAKVLDISTAGLNVIGSVSSNGAPFSPTAQGAGMVNGTIVESHAGNAATFAIKTLAGADPSPTDPVFFSFRNVTPGTGNYVTIQLTAALSLVVSSGSTLGTSSTNVPFRIWFVMFNDGGTLRLGVINCLSLATLLTPQIYPLRGWEIAGSTAEGGAGAADSAGVFYTGTAVTAKAYTIIGYAGYETGLTTAGAWAASPTRIQLATGDTPMPGDTVQVVSAATLTSGTTTSATFANLTNGLTVAITPTSSANIVEAYTSGGGAGSATLLAGLQMLRTIGATPTVIGVPTGFTINSANLASQATLGPFLDYPSSTAACTYSVQGKTTAGTMSYPNNSLGTGVVTTLKEIMT